MSEPKEEVIKIIQEPEPLSIVNVYSEMVKYGKMVGSGEKFLVIVDTGYSYDFIDGKVVEVDNSGVEIAYKFRHRKTTVFLPIDEQGKLLGLKSAKGMPSCLVREGSAVVDCEGHYPAGVLGEFTKHKVAKVVMSGLNAGDEIWKYCVYGAIALLLLIAYMVNELPGKMAASKVTLNNTAPVTTTAAIPTTDNSGDIIITGA